MKLSKTIKTIIVFICALLLIFIVMGTVYYHSATVLPFARGLLLGGALNICKIIMLEYAVNKAVTIGDAAKNYIGLQYLLRFTLTGIVLAVAAVAPFISLLGAAIGIFTLPIATFCAKVFLKHADERG